MAELAAVVFDLDDTLFDHSGSATRGFDSWLAGFHGPATPELTAAWFELQERHFAAWRDGRRRGVAVPLERGADDPRDLRPPALLGDGRLDVPGGATVGAAAGDPVVPLLPPVGRPPASCRAYRARSSGSVGGAPPINV